MDNMCLCLIQQTFLHVCWCIFACGANGRCMDGVAPLHTSTLPDSRMAQLLLR